MIDVKPLQNMAAGQFEFVLKGQRLYSLRKCSGFVSGYRFSDTVSPSKSDAPLGAEEAKSTFSASL